MVICFANSHNSLNRWKNYFCQLLNVHGANDIRQAEMHTVEPLVPEPGSSRAETTVGRYESPGTNQIPANLFILFGIKKNCHSSS